MLQQTNKCECSSIRSHIFLIRQVRSTEWLTAFTENPKVQRRSLWDETSLLSPPADAIIYLLHCLPTSVLFRDHDLRPSLFFCAPLLSRSAHIEVNANYWHYATMSKELMLQISLMFSMRWMYLPFLHSLSAFIPRIVRQAARVSSVHMLKLAVPNHERLFIDRLPQASYNLCCFYLITDLGVWISHSFSWLQSMYYCICCQT